MLTYDEFKEAMDKGFIKGDTVQIVRKNGKVHDYVLDGKWVEPHGNIEFRKGIGYNKGTRWGQLKKHLTGASFLPAKLVNWQRCKSILLTYLLTFR